MKTFFMYFGKFPFAGKFAVRDCFDTLYRSKTFKERLKAYFCLVGLFALFFFGHGTQMVMGTRLVYAQGASYLAIIAGLLYAVINAVVILTHIYLAIRATKFLFSNRYVRNTSHHLAVASGSEMLLSLVMTLAGQLGFGAFYASFV